MSFKKPLLVAIILVVLTTAITYAANCSDLGCHDPDPIVLMECLNSCP